MSSTTEIGTGKTVTSSDRFRLEQYRSKQQLVRLHSPVYNNHMDVTLSLSFYKIKICKLRLIFEKQRLEFGQEDIHTALYKCQGDYLIRNTWLSRINSPVNDWRFPFGLKRTQSRDSLVESLDKVIRLSQIQEYLNLTRQAAIESLTQHWTQNQTQCVKTILLLINQSQGRSRSYGYPKTCHPLRIDSRVCCFGLQHFQEPECQLNFSLILGQTQCLPFILYLFIQMKMTCVTVLTVICHLLVLILVLQAWRENARLVAIQDTLAWIYPGYFDWKLKIKGIRQNLPQIYNQMDRIASSMQETLVTEFKEV